MPPPYVPVHALHLVGPELAEAFHQVGILSIEDLLASLPDDAKFVRIMASAQVTYETLVQVIATAVFVSAKFKELGLLLKGGRLIFIEEESLDAGFPPKLPRPRRPPIRRLPPAGGPIVHFPPALQFRIPMYMAAPLSRAG